jgi:acetyl-CoA acetyltransferase family protein
MSDTAENLAAQCGISRLDSDQYALRSQQAAEQAFQSGKFEEEIVPVEVKDSREMKTVSKDDHRRPSTTLAGLQSLPTAFRGDGMVTAGNSSGITDGAAALVATMEGTAKERGWNILGRIVSWATAGVEPRIMGIGPVPASQKALSLAGLKLDQIDLIEVNEAFAPQYLAVEKELGLDRDKTNVNGGAIAIGHPVGATGARLVLTLLLELRRRGARYGLATACIGGGQGIAMIVESVS